MLHWFPANTHVHKKMSCQLSLLKCRLLVYGTHGTLPTRQWPMPCTVLDCFLLCFLQLHASYFTVEKFCVETWLHATQELKTSLEIKSKMPDSAIYRKQLRYFWLVAVSLVNKSKDYRQYTTHIHCYENYWPLFKM